VRLGTLQQEHRGRLREILDSTTVFRPDEVDVALELFDEGARGDYEFVGGFEGDDLVGYACFGPTPGTDRTYDLYWIALEARLQGRGRGSHLLNEVERRLRQRGARLLVVETSSRPEYEATRQFYLSRDYREAARMRDFYEVGDDRVIFTKSLAPIP
jgi:GNAT superfamily N-acetyltransferase